MCSRKMIRRTILKETKIWSRVRPSGFSNREHWRLIRQLSWKAGLISNLAFSSVYKEYHFYPVHKLHCLGQLLVTHEYEVFWTESWASLICREALRVWRIPSGTKPQQGRVELENSGYKVMVQWSKCEARSFPVYLNLN